MGYEAQEGYSVPLLTVEQYSLGVGGINFGLAVVALFLIDSVGRRLLLVLTLPLMSACQFATAFSFGTHKPVRDHWRHTPVLICSYLFCVFYSIGEGPVPLVRRSSLWLRQLLIRQVYASEILPLEVRDTGRASHAGFSLQMLSYRRGGVAYRCLLGPKFPHGLDMASNV